jgi:hypothetical protein
MDSKWTAIAFAVLLASTTVTHGATVYYDRASFLAAAGLVTTEGFEAYATNTCTYGGPSPSNTFVGTSFTVTSTPTSGSSFLCTGTAGSGPVPTEGNNALIAGSNTGSPWDLEFQILAGPITAFGFDLVDAAEGGSALFFNENGESATIAGCCRPSGSRLFFGFIGDSPFARFTLRNTAVGDGWAIDQVALAPSPVPLPATGWLLLSGLAGLCVAGRRRKAT